ncbi:MAG: hypothetical protein R3F53_19335 [Gammaproteobacteria bacterium]
MKCISSPVIRASLQRFKPKDAKGGADGKGRVGAGLRPQKKPPVLGLIQRGGEVVIRLLENVKQGTIKPVIKARFRPVA